MSYCTLYTTYTCRITLCLHHVRSRETMVIVNVTGAQKNGCLLEPLQLPQLCKRFEDYSEVYERSPTARLPRAVRTSQRVDKGVQSSRAIPAVTNARATLQPPFRGHMHSWPIKTVRVCCRCRQALQCRSAMPCRPATGPPAVPVQFWPRGTVASAPLHHRPLAHASM